MNREQRRTAQKNANIKNKKQMGKIIKAFTTDKTWPEEKILPEGTKVMINTRTVRKGNEIRAEFVKNNKETIFSIKHDPKFNKKPIYSLEEDEHVPRWLFHESELIIVSE